MSLGIKASLGWPWGEARGPGSQAEEGQVKGVCPSCPCNRSLCLSKGFLRAYPLPQPQRLQATEAAVGPCPHPPGVALVVCLSAEDRASHTQPCSRSPHNGPQCRGPQHREKCMQMSMETVTRAPGWKAFFSQAPGKEVGGGR